MITITNKKDVAVKVISRVHNGVGSAEVGSTAGSEYDNGLREVIVQAGQTVDVEGFQYWVVGENDASPAPVEYGTGLVG